MKVSNRLLCCLLAATSLVWLTGCGTPSKSTPGYAPDGTTDTTGLPQAGGTEDMGTGIPQNARPAGVDPENDVDYVALAAETVYFDFDSSVIRGSERGKLEDIAKYLTTNPGKRLMIAGHTDLTGTAEYNRGLGERRALAVRSYLIGLQIPAAQLFTISYGLDKPASPGHSEEDNAKNRRAVPGVITK
jgi:peptidoglycan-associated lipoprotein